MSKFGGGGRTANSQVTRLLIEQCHKNLGHSGPSHTWSTLRGRYWILKGAATVRKILCKCIFCQCRNSTFGKQCMADLPSCRVTPGNPPVFFIGIEYFGPIMVKQGRNRLKRYGCVFTCLTMRAVHLKMSYFLIRIHSSMHFVDSSVAGVIHIPFIVITVLIWLEVTWS